MESVKGLTVSGAGERALAQDLRTYWDVSEAARTLFAAAQAAGVRIEMQDVGKLCHATGTIVSVSRDACLDPVTGAVSRPYLTESVLFEMQNAVNAARYAALMQDVKNGQLSVLQYGLAMSLLEFESTATVVHILAAVRQVGLPVSPWGQRQFSGYALGAAEAANQPHAADSTTERRLPSRLFYAYDYLTNVVRHMRNMPLQALRTVATVHQEGRAMDAASVGRMHQAWSIAHADQRPAQFLVAYVDALLWLDNEAGWSVDWRGGTRSEWKTCATEFVHAVPTVFHDPALSARLRLEVMSLAVA
ncbi:MAG: hypothetical protein KDJ27_15210 [Gammaproteobacteria bacterium]|nr:hypothetical protein [Gammaproteobacteria bacterium]